VAKPVDGTVASVSCQLSEREKIEDARHHVFALKDLGIGRNGPKLRQFGMFLPFAGFYGVARELPR
jgi:hypothetical protein